MPSGLVNRKWEAGLFSTIVGTQETRAFWKATAERIKTVASSGPGTTERQVRIATAENATPVLPYCVVLWPGHCYSS